MSAPHTKKIGLVTSVAFAVGSMIGGGVFVLSGIAIKQAGPAALLSFLIAGLVVLLSALSFAVIASMATARESGYVYVGTVLRSPLWGFLTSWCFYLGGIISTAFVLNAFGIYMHEFVTQHLSTLLWAVIAAAVLTVINLGPASEIGKIETILVGGKLLILLLLVGFGLANVHISDFHPLAPNGPSSIFATSAYLFIAFLGFNVITNISGDINNPRQTVPRAILLSMFIVTIVYTGVVIALLAAHITSYSEASVGLAAQQLIGPIGGILVIAGALISTLSAANANILGSSEVMVRLAARKEVPTIFGHLRRGHPYVSVLAGCVVYTLLILSRQIEVIIGLANVSAITALIIVNVAAARALKSQRHTGLRLPFGSLLPLLGILGAVLQILFIPWPTLLAGIVLVMAGFGIYALRERYHLPLLHRRILEATQTVEGPLGRTLKR